jgi:hypothetical protein
MSPVPRVKEFFKITQNEQREHHINETTTRETMATMTATEEERPISMMAVSTLLHNHANMSEQSKDAMRLMHKEESDGAFINISFPDKIPSPKYESPKCIGYQVQVNLERQKDVQRHKRVELANDIKRLLEQELLNAGYTPHDTVTENPLKAMLFIDIAIASEGNFLGRKLCGDFFVGGAKLVLVWCLQSLETEHVLMGHRSVLIDTVALDGGTWAVKSLAYGMVEDISKRVNKTCHHQRQYLWNSDRCYPILGLPKNESDSSLHLM